MQLTPGRVQQLLDATYLPAELRELGAANDVTDEGASLERLIDTFLGGDQA